jgi:hypothetical protein
MAENGWHSDVLDQRAEQSEKRISSGGWRLWSA